MFTGSITSVYMEYQEICQQKGLTDPYLINLSDLLLTIQCDLQEV